MIVFKTAALFVPTTCKLISSAISLGSYSEILHVFALSAVIKCPIQSYFPPSSVNQFLSDPFSRKCCGRDVNLFALPAFTLMWTQMSIPRSAQHFNPNHFVPLCRRVKQNAPVIKLDTEHKPDHISIDSDDYGSSKATITYASSNQLSPETTSKCDASNETNDG